MELGPIRFEVLRGKLFDGTGDPYEAMKMNVWPCLCGCGGWLAGWLKFN